ncbi:MAG: hypothetical protein IMF13_05320 [Proteobacteria bacterium]|nr:hypothetical protein [Pseudomonadota bacterium]
MLTKITPKYHDREHDIFDKPLGDPILDFGFMRVTNALSDDNRAIVQVLRELL